MSGQSIQQSRFEVASAIEALEVFDEVPLNRREIPQHRLDLDNRTRTNPFPWRGQFSPQFVEVILACYARTGSSILDPFAGVGTTLIEAGRRGLACVGVELNPAAVAMAETCLFLPMDDCERREVCQAAKQLLDKELADEHPFFSGRYPVTKPAQSVLATLVAAHAGDEVCRNLLTNTLIRLSGCDPSTADAAFRCFEQHRAVVMDLPRSASGCRIIHCDARQLPLLESSIDLLVTSPPYINVFNYHQNNRAAMELLGWNMLKVARSEFGANRKHRGNRFLTIVQFCLDMTQAFMEFRRVLRLPGRMIVVVGRESNVRGLAFENGRLVSALAYLAGFELVDRQERKFTSRFGGTIYEDILHLTPRTDRRTPANGALVIACSLLQQAAAGANGLVARDLEIAIHQAGGIQPSPHFEREEARRR